MQSIDVRKVGARARRTLTSLEMKGQGRVTAMLMLLLGEHLGEGEHNVTGLEGPRQSHVGRAPCS